MSRGRLTALTAFLITAAMLAFPDESFKASLAGLKLWFEIVLQRCSRFSPWRIFSWVWAWSISWELS